MATGRHLKNIAIGLLGTFVSRNNDIGGYLGLGVLSKLAEGNDLSHIYIDLWPPDENFCEGGILENIGEHYRNRFSKMVNGVGADITKIEHACIKIEFADFDAIPNAVRNTRGRPYRCTVAISTLQKSYEASAIGVCEATDLNKDQKRAESDIYIALNKRGRLS